MQDSLWYHETLSFGLNSMQGEKDLSTLIQSMQPVLHEQPFAFCSVPPDQADTYLAQCWGLFKEPEGTTLIFPKQAAESLPFAKSQDWALISLHVHSSLTAIGFLARISHSLAAAGISLNAVSAFYHDHLFVPWQERARTLEILKRLSQACGSGQ